MNPFKHQQEAADFILSHDGSGAIFHEIGLGKTRTALEIFRASKVKDPTLKLFVCCPLSLIEAAWGEDIRKFTTFKYRNLHDQDILDAGEDIFIINYESMISNSTFPQVLKLIQRWNFMIVLDESSKLKNHKAKITKTLLAIRHLFKYRIVMSGTPAPNSELEYWAQMNFVKSGIFNEKFYPFRNYYFHLERTKSGGPEYFQGQIITKDMARQMFSQGWHYAITGKKREELMQRILPHCHHAKKIDCLDLPEQLDEKRLVTLPAKLQHYYDEMKREYIIEIKGNFVTAQVALAKIMKLRQITSGFAIDEDSQALDLGSNPKLKELEDILEEAGNQQVIIWCQFHHEINVIKEMLGDKAVTLYGETKEKIEPIDLFKHGKAQYLIAHPRSAGHGLTFVNCSLEVFFSLDYSWEAYEQARGRIHRAGQVNKCTYMHLIARNSIDEEILDVLQHKKEATEILFKMVGDYKCSSKILNAA
jgi:SNF2 family DNA or RNA helicase